MNPEFSTNSEDLQKLVPMIEPKVVQYVRLLTQRGWGSRRIAAELGIARETARRYARTPAIAVSTQERPKGRHLSDADAARVLALWSKEAAGSAVVVRRLMAAEGVSLELRMIQRLTKPLRAAKARQDKATVRFETPPGGQMQIDFGQMLVKIAGAKQRVYFFVAVLGFSRRIFVMASLSERQEDWQEGVANAFLHFGGSTQELLIDNPKAMVLTNTRDGQSRSVVLHPVFAAFCKDWDVTVKACTPRRARTKGKVENGVGYVKRNAIADLEFERFEALHPYLTQWMHDADRRIHGTTNKRPIDVFNDEEAAALSPLPKRPVAARTRRLKRKVANDCFVDVDAVRYSVPHRFVGEHVMVEVGDTQVRIYAAEALVATHPRCQERHRRIVDAEHYAGLLCDAGAGVAPAEPEDSTNSADNARSDDAQAETSRPLAVYEQVVQGAVS